MSAKILIVEDNATNLELMVYLVQAFGHTTFTAANGLEALSSLQANTVDLVVCDLEMPVMDGYTFARHVRAAGQYRGIPLVAVSAYAMVGDREKVLTAGFDGYISKPIDPETFVSSVQAYLPAPLRAPLPSVEQTAAPSVPLPPTVARILVLDDSPTNLSLMRSTLEPSGYEVIPATRIAEAQAVLRQSRLDLIISDLHLSAESGLDFLNWIKQQERLAEVPVLIVTSSSKDSFDRPSAMQAGAARFLSRPIEPCELLAEVKSELKKAGQPSPAD
jgi:two-component system, cell cycle response regulator